MAQDDLISKVKPLTPQSVIDAANRHRDGDGLAHDIVIDAQQADLEGTGKFNFIIASYNATFAAALRLFQVTNGQLQVLASVDPFNIGGADIAIKLVDINGDGNTQIAVEGSGWNAHSSELVVFQWTANALRRLTPPGSNFINAELYDVSGTGVLNIVTSGDAGNTGDPATSYQVAPPFNVYKFDGTQFVLTSTSATDPTGRLAPDGTQYSVFVAARLKPDDFDLEQIRRATRDRDADRDDEVEVRITAAGGLLSGASTGKTIENIAPKSLILGQNLRPSHTDLLRRNDEHYRDGDRDKHLDRDEDGPVLKAFFSRNAVLKYLPRAQLNKPLAPGDKLTLDLRGKLKNGAPVTGSVSVKITDDHDGHHGRDRDHHD